MPRQLKDPPLKSCCGCQSLRNGSLIIGVLTMIAAALTIVYVILTKHKLETILIELSQTTIKIILVFNLFMTILISGILVLGVLKEKKFYMVMWIILGVMLIISWVLSVIYYGFDYAIKGFHLEAVVWSLVGILIALLYFYLWAVVYSYYLELKREDERLPYYQPATSR